MKTQGNNTTIQSQEADKIWEAFRHPPIKGELRIIDDMIIVDGLPNDLEEMEKLYAELLQAGLTHD